MLGVKRGNMYQFTEEEKRIYEKINVPLLFFEMVEGEPVPALVSDGLLDFHGVTRESLNRDFGGFIKGSLLEKVHPDEVLKLRSVTDDFVSRKLDRYDIIFQSRRDDGYHTVHAVGTWQQMRDGVELALVIYMDLSRSEQNLRALLDGYHLFEADDFYKDPLTGLPNINYMHQYGAERVKEMIGKGTIPVVLYFDLDSMQSYNSQYGFKKGDELLVLLTSILRDEYPEAMIIRGVDDHFIVLDAYTSKVEMIEVCKTVNRRVRMEAFGNTTGIHVGICKYKKGMDAIAMLDHAKQANKNLERDMNICYKFYSDQDKEKYQKQRYIVENFYRAINNGWIKVYYQCFLRVETGNGYGFEALARWVDPDKGLISPGDFIPALEKYHLMYDLDLYMFEQVCREVEPRYDAGLPLLPVSVNFSRQDFDYIDIPKELDRIVEEYHIEQYGIDKSYFIIEITEQDMAVGTENFYKQLDEIRKSGYQLWIDDFGSGYSSLNIFSRFDVDLVKFDMELLKDLDRHNGANREIIKAMIGVAKKLGIHTLCEGMETEEQKEFLKAAGCELAQGFLYHKPEALDTIFDRLKIGIPIPKWETTEERKKREKMWTIPM